MILASMINGKPKSLLPQLIENAFEEVSRWSLGCNVPNKITIGMGNPSYVEAYSLRHEVALATPKFARFTSVARDILKVSPEEMQMRNRSS